jgi:hypothetical protein
MEVVAKFAQDQRVERRPAQPRRLEGRKGGLVQVVRHPVGQGSGQSGTRPGGQGGLAHSFEYQGKII